MTSVSPEDKLDFLEAYLRHDKSMPAVMAEFGMSKSSAYSRLKTIKDECEMRRNGRAGSGGQAGQAGQAGGKAKTKPKAPKAPKVKTERGKNGGGKKRKLETSDDDEGKEAVNEKEEDAGEAEDDNRAEYA